MAEIGAIGLAAVLWALVAREIWQAVKAARARRKALPKIELSARQVEDEALLALSDTPVGTVTSFNSLRLVELENAGLVTITVQLTMKGALRVRELNARINPSDLRKAV